MEAEELGVRVMETRKRVLGLDHPSTLTSMANLATTYITPTANSLGRQARLRPRLCHGTHPATVLITLWCLVEEP